MVSSADAAELLAEEASAKLEDLRRQIWAMIQIL
jgi:hypothetical protein